MAGLEALNFYRSSFKTPPYAHQGFDVVNVLDHEFFGLFSEMGTGKTKVVVDSACILNDQAKIDAVLVVSPAAVRSVWINPDFGEIKKHAWLKSRVIEFHNPLRTIWEDKEPELNWIVTNYEYLRSTDHRQELVDLLHGHKFMMVLDESSFIKSRGAVQTKACLELAKLAVRRVILNGTPIGNNPFDLWSQMSFLSPRILPYKNFYHFRSEFAVMGGWHNHQVIQWKNLDRLQDHIAPFVIRREKKDCLDLPPKIYTQLEVPLSPENWQRYKDMRDEAVVWLNENPSLASQAGVRVMRLSQITSGFLGGFIPQEVACEDCEKTAPDSMDPKSPGYFHGRCDKHRSLEDDGPKAEEIGREKLDLLRTWVSERLEERPNRKLIVWCRFRRELERIAKDFADLLPTYKLYGQGKAERIAAIAKFSQHDGKPALLAAQPQAGGWGLNLVTADAVAYSSNDFNLMTRLQSEDRVHRPGQTERVVYLDVLATGPKGQKTVDHHIVKALRNKNDLATWTCSAWKRLLQEE